MPLTPFQEQLARLLAPQRSLDSHLAGDAALHRVPNSKRYSNDLDYFHDSVERVAKAFEEDRAVLLKEGYDVAIQMNQPGYIRAIVSKGDGVTKVEWSHDTAWRFMPTIKVDGIGYQLHPVDLAINKLLALVGRDEPRDFIDILYVHDTVLPLGALVWAAVGKDPGFTPNSLLELLKRRGKYRADDFKRLQLTEEVDLVAMKTHWLEALADAEKFIRLQPPEELGCLYYSKKKEGFVAPDRAKKEKDQDVVPHFGRPGGLLPKVMD
ncbi:MAG: hypothetical protein KDD70_02130 [Bdellovibrionales bacterium]|nr:hypothetical protein [Bdellovibrionales bacterium]